MKRTIFDGIVVCLFYLPQKTYNSIATQEKNPKDMKLLYGRSSPVIDVCKKGNSMGTRVFSLVFLYLVFLLSCCCQRMLVLLLLRKKEGGCCSIKNSLKTCDGS